MHEAQTPTPPWKVETDLVTANMPWTNKLSDNALLEIFSRSAHVIVVWMIKSKVS